MLKTSVIVLSLLCSQMAPAWAQKGADQINIHGQVLTAARAGNAAAVQQLIAQGGSPNVRDRLGNSALNLAATRGDEAMVDVLLAAQADVQQPNLAGVTPLMGASFAARPAIVRKLLAAGAAIAPLDRVHKNAATYAAAQGCTDCLAALVEAGQSVDAPLDAGLTLLMWAAGQGHEDTVRWLLAHGADASRRDARGKRAADIAADAGELQVAKRLQMEAH
ncbi:MULTISPECIES: ankyrin repeat domain-containing protein [Ramlibacter]|uniref:Ankyrin repeat domain-containing protein n=1 Tax=Ramlibacter aquaticus TaxID=2780094 RepID=A0ABR9SFQ6_9BURK|nr:MULTISPECIES: ankyrin repeat domain-containing protein [Ramlibacter]MBE7941090.1 ankyrin repeat domain-containing protein [Ramlibacter aquaticus]